MRTFIFSALLAMSTLFTTAQNLTLSDLHNLIKQPNWQNSKSILTNKGFVFHGSDLKYDRHVIQFTNKYTSNDVEMFVYFLDNNNNVEFVVYHPIMSFSEYLNNSEPLSSFGYLNFSSFDAVFETRGSNMVFKFENTKYTLEIQEPLGQMDAPITIYLYKKQNSSFTSSNSNNYSSGNNYNSVSTSSKSGSSTYNSSSSSSYSSDTQTYTVNGVSFKMVRVEGGAFRMGSNDSDADDDEKPIHSVSLSSYSIGQTEVTQELWRTVMGNNPSCYNYGGKYPVENVSWNEMDEFIRRLNYLTGKKFRLPTEAEWEFAARGGNKSKGYKYAGNNSIGSVAWYGDNSSNQPHPVAQKSPNELGLYDMSGNVLEMCSDWYGTYSSYLQTNPRGATSGSYRVWRGGSWGHDAWSSRVSNRNKIIPDFRFHLLGFRLAL